MSNIEEWLYFEEIVKQYKDLKEKEVSSLLDPEFAYKMVESLSFHIEALKRKISYANRCRIANKIGMLWKDPKEYKEILTLEKSCLKEVEVYLQKFSEGPCFNKESHPLADSVLCVRGTEILHKQGIEIYSYTLFNKTKLYKDTFPKPTEHFEEVGKKLSYVLNISQKLSN